jgi:hypothetical protein
VAGNRAGLSGLGSGQLGSQPEGLVLEGRTLAVALDEIEAAGSREPPRQDEVAMTKLIGRMTGRGKKAARKAYQKLETKILVAEGRKAVRAKAKTVARVTRRAAKTGVIVGTLAAAGVVVREIRKRLQED